MYLHPSAVIARQDADAQTTSASADPTATAMSSTDGLVATSTVSSSSASSVSSTATPTPNAQTGQRGQGAGVIIGVIVGILVITLISLGLYFCRRARLQDKDPKYIPTKKLKDAWCRWNPRAKHDRLSVSDDRDAAQARAEPTTNMTQTRQVIGTEGAQDGGVARNASIRSIMTLPAYNPNASHTEQVLGREGERAGIDVVIEFPETTEEDEQQREAEMEALYQVRLARRRENEERDERRRLRREAREQGDLVALRELQNAPRGNINPGGRTIEELRADHERIKRERARVVSSVSYADLGVARHDGSRLRSNSDENDNERQGLLGDAASFGTTHRRERSDSSTTSLETTDLALGRLRGNSQPGTPLRTVETNASASTSHTATDGSPEVFHDAPIPPNSPPGYENIPLDDEPSSETGPPPDYTSPPQSRVNSVRDANSGQHGSIRSAASTEVLARTGMSPAPTSNPPSRQSSLSTSVAASLPHRLPSLRLGGLPELGISGGTPLVGHADEDDEGPAADESSDEEDLGPRRTAREHLEE